jgi:hypothetical protein
VACSLLCGGLDVLVEKPLAADRDAAREILEAARQGDRILQVGHIERFSSALSAVLPAHTRPRFIEAHRIGPYSGRATDVSVVLDLMIHDLDIVGQLAGADPAGRPLVYTPNPVRPGSSVSHFDVSAFPNLLMEPAINSDLGQDVDLTLALFEDLGWLIGSGTPAPPASIPGETALHPNVPNPFNPSTRIRFELPRSQDITLDVYDLRGRRVRRLAQGTWDAGEHGLVWDGTDDQGRTVPSGVYVSRLRAADGDLSRRMVLLK